MSKPIVSVLIDTYNHERFIEQAIVSVLEQQGVSPAEMEVVVVDDGSTDNTAEVVRKFAPRVRCLSKPNGGQASAFNAGVPETRGEIVSFLDGDDWWAPNKLRAVLEQMGARPEVGAVGHGFYEVDAEGHSGALILPQKKQELHLSDRASARQFTYLRCFLGTSRITLRRGILERILPVPEELVIEADEYLFTLAPAMTTTLVLDRPLFYYRSHPGNLFQFVANDAAKFRRKQNVLAALLRVLPPRLRELGIPEPVIQAVLEPIWVDAERLRLALDGGKPWTTFQVERASFRHSYSETTLGYRAFHALVLGLTLVLPPPQFYRLRQWYAEKNLRKLRSVVGEPTVAAPILERRLEA